MNVKILFLFHPEMKKKNHSSPPSITQQRSKQLFGHCCRLLGRPETAVRWLAKEKQKFLLSNSIRLFGVWWLDIDDDALKCAETN